MVRIRILIPANRIQEATKWLIRIKGPSEGELNGFTGASFLRLVPVSSVTEPEPV